MLRRNFVGFGLLLGALGSVGAAEAQAVAGDLLYVGTRATGPDAGIYSVRLDTTTGALSGFQVAASVERATTLKIRRDIPVLYASTNVSGDGRADGTVLSYAIDPSTGRLTLLSKAGSGGGDPTYLDVSKDLRTLFVANFLGGQVSALPLQPTGSVGATASVIADFGSGPHPRQTGPHAHSAVMDPTERYVLSADLGADRVFINRFDAATRTLSRGSPPFESFPAGSGPRLVLFHPNGRFVYINTELDAHVRVFEWDAGAGRLRPVQDQPIDPPGYSGERSAGFTTLSADGRFFYVTNRGQDQIVVYAVDPATGRLSELQRVESGGKGPWSLALHPSGRWMVAANFTANNLTAFRVDLRSGRLTRVGPPISAPQPVSVGFYAPG